MQLQTYTCKSGLKPRKIAKKFTATVFVVYLGRVQITWTEFCAILTPFPPMCTLLQSSCY